MSAARENLGRPQATESRERAPESCVMRNRRALALLVALVVLAVLGVGWLADGAATTPSAASDGALTRQAGLATLSLSVSPAPLRVNQPEALTLRIVDAAGQPVVGARVNCALSMPEMAMALPAVAAQPAAQRGVYVCETQLLESGAWTLTVTLTPGVGKPVHAEFLLNAA